MAVKKKKRQAIKKQKTDKKPPSEKGDEDILGGVQEGESRKSSKALPEDLMPKEGSGALQVKQDLAVAAAATGDKELEELLETLGGGGGGKCDEETVKILLAAAAEGKDAKEALLTVVARGPGKAQGPPTESQEASAAEIATATTGEAAAAASIMPTDGVKRLLTDEKDVLEALKGKASDELIEPGAKILAGNLTVQEGQQQQQQKQRDLINLASQQQQQQQQQQQHRQQQRHHPQLQQPMGKRTCEGERARAAQQRRHIHAAWRMRSLEISAIA